MTGSAVAPRGRGPVIVLTAARSGSTLLRFILDSHPELACPPETNVLTAMVNLAHARNVLEAAGTGRAANAAAAIALPPEAVRGLRDTVDGLYQAYLRRAGKARWCDKSIGSAAMAGLFLQVYPEAQFICLYRHCMDVIMSALEACPWGLNGFGFEPFTAQHPDNHVAALGHYWLAHTQAIRKVEEQHPGRCHRVRYEDLVSDPEAAAGALFGFLGVRHVPGITRDCFRREHASNGLGDAKIWFTDRIDSRSVGRGQRVPAHRLPADLAAGIQRMLGQLGYEPPGPANPQPGATQPGATQPGATQPGATQPAAGAGDADATAAAEALSSRLDSATAETLACILRRWPELEGRRLRIAVRGPGGDQDPGPGRELSRLLRPSGTGPAPGPEAGAGPGVIMSGAPGTWRAVLSGQANMATEIVKGALHVTDDTGDGRLHLAIAYATSMLLGLSPTPAP